MKTKSKQTVIPKGSQVDPAMAKPARHKALVVKKLAPTQETSLIAVIARAAADPTVDVAKMEKLLEMHERIVAREAMAEFNSAMADMQPELPVITEKGEIKVGDEIRSTYAKFEDINEFVKPTLQKYGFSVMFTFPPSQNEKISVSGHSVETSLSLPADASGSKNAVQAIKSSTSYGKRIILTALLNISTKGEDDDAMGTMAKVSEEQVEELGKLVKHAGANEAAFLGYLAKNGKVSISTLADIPAKMFADAKASLEHKIKINAKRKEAEKANG